MHMERPEAAVRRPKNQNDETKSQKYTATIGARMIRYSRTSFPTPPMKSPGETSVDEKQTYGSLPNALPGLLQSSLLPVSNDPLLRDVLSVAIESCVDAHHGGHNVLTDRKVADAYRRLTALRGDAAIPLAVILAEAKRIAEDHYAKIQPIHQDIPAALNEKEKERERELWLREQADRKRWRQRIPGEIARWKQQVERLCQQSSHDTQAPRTPPFTGHHTSDKQQSHESTHRSPSLEHLEDRNMPSLTPTQQAVYDQVAQSRTTAVSTLDTQEATYQQQIDTLASQRSGLNQQLATLDDSAQKLAAATEIDGKIATIPQITTPQWQTNNRTHLQGIDGVPLHPFVRFSVSPNGTQILAIRDNGSASVLDTKTGQQVRGFETGITGASAIEWSPSGTCFVVSGKEGNTWKVQVRSATGGELIMEKNFGTAGVNDAHFSPDGTRVSVAKATGQSYVFTVATGAEAMHTSVSSVGTYSSAFSRDGNEYYTDVHTSSTSGYIAAYDAATGALKRKYEGITGSVTSFSISPDGTYLLAAGSNGHVYVYNAATGAVVTAVTEAGAGYVTSAVWNDAGNAFAVGRGLTSSDKTGATVYTFTNGTVQQSSFTPYPEGTEILKLRFLPGSQTLLIQETTWASGESFYTSIGALSVPANARPASGVTLSAATQSVLASFPSLPQSPTTRAELIQIRDALVGSVPTGHKTAGEIAAARTNILDQIAAIDTQQQAAFDFLTATETDEAAVDAFFADYALQMATVLNGDATVTSNELLSMSTSTEDADTQVLEAQTALWNALNGSATDATLSDAADALAQSMSQRAAAYGSLTPATLASPAPAGVDLLSLAGARGTDALKSALLEGAGTLSHTVFARSIAILSKTTEGPWDAKELWQARVSVVTGQNAVAAQTALDQLTASLTIRERNAATNQTVSRPLVRPSERQALLQTLTPQARQTAADFQQAYRLSGLTSGSRNETADNGVRFYSTALDRNFEIRPNGDVVENRVVIATLDPLFHSRPELLETLVPDDGLDAFAAEHGYGLRETYAAGILVSQLGAVRMTLGSPNNDHVREGEFLNAQGVPVARVYVENGTGFVQYMNRSFLSGLSAAALADTNAFLAVGRTATTYIGATGILPERGAFVARSTVEQAAAFATQYGLELKGGSVHKNALGQGEESAWSTTLNTWLVWKDGKVMTEQEFLQSIKNPSYAPQVLATFNVSLGGMAFVTGAPERLHDGDLLNSLPAQARMQMNALTTDSGAMLNLSAHDDSIIATDTLTNRAWVWDITTNSWRDVSANSAADLSASVTVTERSLDWSPTFQRTFAESALSTLGLSIPSVRDFAIRINPALFGRTQDDDLAALRRNAYLFTGQWDGQAYSTRYQSLVESRLDTLQSAQQQYNTEYARLLDAIRAAYGSEEARRAGEQGSDAWKQTVPLSLTTAAAIAEGVSNNFYRLYQTVLDLNHSTRALASGANREAEANAYDAKIIRQFEQSVIYIRDHADAFNTPFSTRIARLILNTDPGVLQKYFAGTAVVGPSLDTLTPKLQQTFVAVYSSEPDVERRVAGIWGVEGMYRVAGNGLEMQIQQNDQWLATAEEISGIGGAEQELNEQRAQLAGQTLEQAKAHLLSLYQDSNTQEYPMIGGQYVRDDTIAGRIFHGLYQKGFSMNDADFKSALVEAEKVLGVRARYIWHAGRTHDFQRFQKMLISEFTAAGMGHIFLGSDTSKKIAHAPMQVELAAVTPDKTSYGKEDDVIRLTFDIALPTGMQNFSPAAQRVYIINALTEEQLSDIGLAVRFIDANTVEISTSAIINQVGGGNGYFGLLSFKLALWPTGDTSLSGLQGENISKPVQVELVKNSGLSTNENQEQAEKEKTILRQLADKEHFVIRSPEQWYWMIGSDFHDGGAVNAVDLNLASGDAGEPVYASADGKVIKAGGDNTNTVIIEHEAIAADGTTFKWYTKYLHMQNLAVHRNGQTMNLTIGMDIKKDDQIGQVGDEGANNAFHLHFEVLMGSLTGTSVDLRKLLMDTKQGFGMIAKAFDIGADGLQGEWEDSSISDVIWNETLGAFMTVNVDPVAKVHLILDRTAQIPTVDQEHSRVFWRLQEFEGQKLEEMKAVVWDKVEKAWFQWDPSTNDWLRNAENKRMKWINTNQESSFTPSV